MKTRRLIAALFSIMAVSLSLMAQKSVYIDCYGADAGSGWNNINIASDGANASLVGSDGTISGMSLYVSTRMTAGTFSVSTNSFSGDALEFLPAGANATFGSVSSWEGNPACPQAELVFSGLDTGTAYTFTYFASRNNDGTGWNREGEYILNGATSVTNHLDAADNFSQTAVSDAVYPDAGGQITLILRNGPNNNADAGNGRYYFYLNALKIEYAPVLADSDPETIYIDPTSGGGYIGSGWNGISFLAKDASLSLTTSNDLASGIQATVITELAGANSNGSTSPSGDAAEFAPAGGDSVYGCDVTFSGNLAPEGIVLFSGLNTNVAYHFTMYASRMGVTDNREAEYTLSGAETNSVVLNAAANSSQVVVVSNVYSDAEGKIEFKVAGGPGNNNSYGFYYLSAMKIMYVPPSPQLVGELYVDVAGSNSGSNWNQVHANTANSMASLITSIGDVSGYKIVVERSLNSGLNYNATGSPTGAAGEFSPMGNQNVYGANGTYSQGVLSLSNLNPSHLYDFTFFASRMSVSDNREGLYTVSGVNSGSATLDAANNTSNVCTVAGIKPTAQGEIAITLQSGDNNTTSAGYFYLGAFKISDYEVAGVVSESIPASAKRLLFFGDQFSMGQNIPGLLRDLAVVGGYEMPVVVADLESDIDMAGYIGRVADYAPCNVDSVILPDGDSWDHVIVQGSGTESSALGDSLAFKTNAVELYQAVIGDASGKGVGSEALLLQTWAAQEGHSYYPVSFADPSAMQLDIRTNYAAAAQLINIAEGAGSADVAGVGDAFETGEFYYALYEEDGFAESALGARLAAMVLYKKIYNEDATNLSYDAAISAGWTSMAEFDWDRLALWADGVASSLGDAGMSEIIYVDPYGEGAPTTWNSASFATTDTDMELRDTVGRMTGISLDVTDSILGNDTLGSASPTGDAAEFALAGRSVVYGRDSTPTNTVVFSGMKPGRSYEFTFYNSRMGVTDNRDTTFTLIGSSQVSGNLNASDNDSEVEVLTVRPATDGSVVLNITKGPDNDNSEGLFYLSAMKIRSSGFGTIMVLE